MRKIFLLTVFVVLFGRPASCQQKATAPVGVCVQSSELRFTPAALPKAFVGTTYSESLSGMVSGGTAPYTWAVTSGTLPVGIILSTTGVLSGTPTDTGSFTFSVTVTDSSVACTPVAVTAKHAPLHQSVTVAVRTEL